MKYEVTADFKDGGDKETYILDDEGLKDLIDSWVGIEGAPELTWRELPPEDRGLLDYAEAFGQAFKKVMG